jgi:ribose transport system ATP-binding protein
MSHPDDQRDQAPLLEVEGVTKGFPGVQALQDMHLNLRNGEVLALIGENGAGKSTLMKLLSGIYTPDAGEFRLDGEAYRPEGPKDAESKGVGIIHQELNLVPDLTVAQNIFIGREPLSGRFFTRDRELNRRATELLDRLGLHLDPAAVVGSLTVAKQQMVEIAKALSHDSRVLILDEPTAALNDAEVEVLHGLIRRFVGPRTGAIYISHRMDELKQISDRITVVRDGRYVGTVDTEQSTMRDVITMMVGRELAVDAAPENMRDDREVLLSVQGLSTKALLRDVTFDLRAGEILGFAGLMGAGRTEVARALVGADRVSAGTVTLRGKRVAFRNAAQAAAAGIGYLSEDRKRYGLMLNHSVAANISLSSVREQFSRGGLVDDQKITAVSEQYVERLGIRTPSTRQEVRLLSGGNQQKVVIAKWLVKDCDVLIVDEPTRGVDVGAKDEIYRLLNELAAAGKSIVMISSELPEVLRMAHRVVVMSEGRVTGVLPAKEATQERVMHLATLRTDEDDPVVDPDSIHLDGEHPEAS